MVGMFSVRSIWPTDEERKAAVSELYNFKTLRKRKWLQDVLLEESDSDSDGEFPFTLPDLHTIVKVFFFSYFRHLKNLQCNSPFF
ncbi:unnamed protein product [Gongylonema pulchrum]|uniref:Uncharacterized protein n=1 Tax=Gongylonema pulchrum TaxID=637853 RepID=A0A183EHT7_9BILA|nr:unnamed protein product [Gongylonema pulchrum]